MTEVEQTPRIPNAPLGESVPVYILEDAQKQIAEMKHQAESAISRMQDLDVKIKELEKVNSTFYMLEADLKQEIKTLRDHISKKDMQIRELSNRELEARVKSEVFEKLLEGLFEKVVDKI